MPADWVSESSYSFNFRRRARNYSFATILLTIFGAAIFSLPFVKIDLVSYSRGMIRASTEPVKIYSPVSGILNSTILQNNLSVHKGDTIVWLKQDHLNAELEKYNRLIRLNKLYLSDIAKIKQNSLPLFTARYTQSHSNHLAGINHLQIQINYQENEFEVAKILYHDQVIPEHEFDKIKSEYHISTSGMNRLNGQYLNTLEEESSIYNLNIEKCVAEISRINVSRNLLYITAPVSGTIQNSPGLAEGSVINFNHHLGDLSPSGTIIAECYVEPSGIPLIIQGMKTHLHIDGYNYRQWGSMDAEVVQIANDVILINNSVFYKVTCRLSTTTLIHPDGKMGTLMKGMTFTASFIRGRQSISSLILGRIDSRLNPVESFQNK